MKYDIVIAHRVCPALSKTAVGFADKRSMVEATTKSLKTALRDLAVRLVVILDDCREYEEIFRKEFGASQSVSLEVIHTEAIGNQATWGLQLGILSSVHDSDFVYFSEDDYIYRSDAFSVMLDFAKKHNIDFVTPLDHPDRYNAGLENPLPTCLLLSDVCHWREVFSTCLTFLGKAKSVADCRRIMESYVYSTEEATMWLGLTKHGVFDVISILKAAFKYFVLRRKCRFGELMCLCTWKRQGMKLLTHRRRRLFSPIPSLSVHLSSRSLPLGSVKLLKNVLPDEALNGIQVTETIGLSLGVRGS